MPVAPTLITFSLFIDPVPKARPRLARSGHCYTPAKTATFERQVARLSDEWVPVTKLEGPLSLRVGFYLKKPKSTKRTYPHCRPDLDNYIKAIMDGLSAFWVDDAQVIRIYAEKVYTETRPHITIEIVSIG